VLAVKSVMLVENQLGPYFRSGLLLGNSVEAIFTFLQDAFYYRDILSEAFNIYFFIHQLHEALNQIVLTWTIKVFNSTL
jgi:hypothetical protein